VARNTDHLKYSNPHLITDQVRLHDLDITSCNSLPSADYVIHAAASTNANDYLMRPDEEKETFRRAPTITVEWRLMAIGVVR